MKKRKILAMLLAFLIAFSSFGEFSPIEAENALTDDKMKEVLVIVKGKLDIGDQFDVFDYNYSEYSGNGRFYFYWNTEDDSEQINVTADDTGRVLSYNRYSSNAGNDGSSHLPNYIGEELVPKAIEWLYQTEPELTDKLDLSGCTYQSYRKTYRLKFTRIENGIRMNDNYVSISMDAMDAKVLSYGVNWNFEVEIPKVEKPITEKKAAQKVGENVEMQLQYRLGYDNDGNEKVFLAYNPDRTYIAVDAKNGKVYTEKVYWGSGTDFDEGFNEEGEMAADNAEAQGSYNGKSVRLSDAEIKKIDEIKDIITSEQAVELIKGNEKLYIDENINSYKCSLYSKDDEYYWRITLSDDRPVDYDSPDYDKYGWYRASATAQMNAKTGKLISFSAYTRGQYYYEKGGQKFSPKYSEEECRAFFEEFAKETDPDKYEFVKFTNVYDQNVSIYSDNYNIEDSVVGGYSYSFGRYYKDIPFSANSISGGVEAVTGKITSYYVNWTDAKLPEPENLIGEKKAFDSYIACDGFDLIYELVSKYEESSKYYGVDKEVKARLVYRTAISPYLIDAFTGKQITWSGEEYKPAGVSYKYTDIAGTKYERAIKLLADMGLGFEGEKFLPSKKITNEEFEKLLVSNGYGRYYYADEADEDGEDDPDEALPDDETRVTRQEAAKLIITAMGAAKLGKMDIFKTGYSDEKKIDKENIGYVALCKGLEIMGAKTGNKFKPNASVTRGEAADLILRMISANIG